MRDSDDLKSLLEKLRGEVAPLPQPQQERELPPAETGRRLPPPVPRPQRGFRPAGAEHPQPPAQRPDRYSRPYPEPEKRPSPASPQNLAWSEHRESILFGMLASLVLALGGILAGLDYLVLTGAVFFALFALVMVLVLFRVALRPAGGGGEKSLLPERVDALSRKVEMLSSRAAVSGAPQAQAGGSERERELERSVEELRVLVKGLVRSADSER